ncbi:hypothetical protein JWJ90_07090 [Desulfobulbus rhabdoformis]|uniref:hypothetical protein n=1 Tax=Desulfobulbus rhabdoformis TaxID=34032 RepID=UPI0019643E31|nr:hypothetical protein [Desulfobulbus rhabdoformis]MBM9614049.1 hypothetical protein [Desulfobulbus rhabdoformis]
MNKSQKRLVANLIFVAVCGFILYFLLSAPPETTAPLPHDADHEPFMKMHKKEAEKFCESCHAPDKQAPLPETHPPKYRCLFCHKRI